MAGQDGAAVYIIMLVNDRVVSLPCTESRKDTRFEGTSRAGRNWRREERISTAKTKIMVGKEYRPLVHPGNNVRGIRSPDLDLIYCCWALALLPFLNTQQLQVWPVKLAF